MATVTLPGSGLLTLNQTDGSATHGQSVSCSGASLTADTGNDRAATDGGTLGTSTFTVTLAGSATKAAIFFESTAIPYSPWPASVWTVPLNVTVANTNITIEEVYVCRVNSSGVSQGTIASLTSLGIIATAKVHFFQPTQASSQATANTDRAYFVLVLKNASGSSQAITVKPNQQILTSVPKVQSITTVKESSGDLPHRADVTMTALPPTVTTNNSVTVPTPPTVTATANGSGILVRTPRMVPDTA